MKIRDLKKKRHFDIVSYYFLRNCVVDGNLWLKQLKNTQRCTLEKKQIHNGRCELNRSEVFVNTTIFLMELQTNFDKYGVKNPLCLPNSRIFSFIMNINHSNYLKVNLISYFDFLRSENIAATTLKTWLSIPNAWQILVA